MSSCTGFWLRVTRTQVRFCSATVHDPTNKPSIVKPVMEVANPVRLRAVPNTLAAPITGPTTDKFRVEGLWHFFSCLAGLQV